MRRRSFRQIDARYFGGKFASGSSLNDVSKNMYNPVEEMNYVTGSASDKKIPGWFILFCIIVSLILLFLKYLVGMFI